MAQRNSYAAMPTVNLPQDDVGFSYLKVAFVAVLFVLSLVSFVTQTELTSVLFTTYGMKDPIFLMTITHGSWWMLWPAQFVLVALYKTVHRYRLHKAGYTLENKPWKGIRRAFASSVKTQHRNVAHSAQLTTKENHPEYIEEFPHKGHFGPYSEFFHSRAFKHMYKCSAGLSVLLNVAGATWYISMQLSTGADVTAIYNSSAFTAYLFAIPILHEAFSLTKMASVLCALSGVGIVAYATNNDNAEDYPYRTLGNLIILCGAVIYGLYEVLYKKWCCPPSNEVSARRQATFSNFTMCLIGINSAIFLGAIIVVGYLTGIYKCQLPSGGRVWLYTWLSVLANLVYSVSFLGLMSLTSPVFSSVASLVTILIVGLYEWMFRGIEISKFQLFGYVLIMAGFATLTYASWNEISEEDKDDELLETDTESTMTDTESTYMT